MRHFRFCHILTLLAANVFSQNVTEYVDPFIGTAGGGNTFPGAVRPWGMVSVSPHNAHGVPSGYIYGKTTFYGFGHVHLSGTGCADLGSVILSASRGDIRSDPNKYTCTFTDEAASPGYYRAVLKEPGFIAEATATSRCGFTKLTSTRDGEANILIDAGRSLNGLMGGSITITSNTEVEGYNISGGFCGEANRQRVYFVARFSEPALEKGIWIGQLLTMERSATSRDSGVGSWFKFRTKANQSIMVKVGISYVSVENARMNLDAELPLWDFEEVRKDAQVDWNEQLSHVKVEGGTNDNFVKFYTALYHMLIHPNIISDVNGEYPLMGRFGTGRYTGRNRYTVFSLWDTYRTLHPFLTLVFPERQSAIIQTMIDMYRESGWLPKWELAANETYLMVGDAAGIVIADSYIKGITDFDVQTAHEGIKKPSERAGEIDALARRPGYHEYLRYGYIPFEQDTTQTWWVWGTVSTTLEYCLADWAFAQLAKKIGKASDALEFKRRSLYYRKLFDTSTRFMRPKLKSGAWLNPFDPLQTEGSGTWAGSGGPGFVEGNAWHYTWFVPHDVYGLVELFGGKKPFIEKLLQSFDDGHFNIENEPDIAYPYLFTYVPGEEQLTQMLVRTIMDQQFGLGAAGLPGNDDAGTISGWFVFSALGFYPSCPGSEMYQLGLPLFRKASIGLNGKYYSGKEFIVELDGNSEKASVRSVELNGRTLDRYHINHSQIISGGKLVFLLKD